MATPSAADLKAIINLRPSEAIAYLKRKGFAITWDWQEVDAATHGRAFTVAKATRLDLLQDIRNALTDNLERGQTLRDFQNNLRPTLEAKGWWGKQVVVSPEGEAEVVQLGSPRRLATIYQTNLQSAYMAGRYAAAMESSGSHPYWLYLAVMDGSTRPGHAVLNGKVFRFDDPIWSHILPPNGYNCRCRFVAISQRELERRGLKVESSQGQTRTQTVETGVDPRTGEIRQQRITSLRTTDLSGKPITFRPDAGFDGSPVQSHLMDDLLLRKAQNTLGDEQGLAEVQQALLDPVRLKAWQAFVDTALKAGRPQGQTMSFGVLSPVDLRFSLAKSVAVQSGIIYLDDKLLSGAKARRHDQAGNALSADEWKTLPLLMAEAEQVLWDTENSTLLYVLPAEDDRVSKLLVRFGRLRSGGNRVEDVATVFKVPQVAIRDGLARGLYQEVR